MLNNLNEIVCHRAAHIPLALDEDATSRVAQSQEAAAWSADVFLDLDMEDIGLSARFQ